MSGRTDKEQLLTTDECEKEQASDPYSRRISSTVGKQGCVYSCGTNGVLITHSRIVRALQRAVPMSLRTPVLYFALSCPCWSLAKDDYSARCNVIISESTWQMMSIQWWLTVSLAQRRAQESLIRSNYFCFQLLFPSCFWQWHSVSITEDEIYKSIGRFFTIHYPRLTKAIPVSTVTSTCAMTLSMDICFILHRKHKDLLTGTNCSLYLNSSPGSMSVRASNLWRPRPIIHGTAAEWMLQSNYDGMPGHYVAKYQTNWNISIQLLTYLLAEQIHLLAGKTHLVRYFIYNYRA